MVQKGSKYARKHHVDEPQNLKEDFEEEAFMQVINEDISFLDIFNGLPLSEQIKAYQVLKKLAETSTEKLKKAEKELIMQSRYKLDTINHNAGLKKEEMLKYPLSTDEHHIIRMDCYGTIDARPSHQLSSFYKEYMNNPMSKKLPMKSYDLENAPMWKIFRQFENFRKIEPEIKRYLSSHKIDPEMLNLIAVKDFSDLIYQTFKEGNSLKATFVKTDSERNAFVKDIANFYGNVIFDILDSQGHDHRYIHSLLNAMKTYGLTDVSHIIITETHFTEKVLADLKKAKIPIEDYKVGEKIPQDLINDLIYNDKGFLLIARDENMIPLKTSDFPSFQVHHKVAVSESGKLAALPLVNYRNNFLLVESNIHGVVLHGFDKLLVANGKEAYRSRMEFVDTHLSFMAGFSKDEQISINWLDYAKIAKKEAEDAKYIISYEDCINELNEHRITKLKNSNAGISFDLHGVVKKIRRKHKGQVSKTTTDYFKKAKGAQK